MAQTPVCLHEGCTCVAVEGEFCSDYCRRMTGQELVVCGCGHRDCAGTADDGVAV